MKRTFKDIIKRFFVILTAVITFSLLVPQIVPAVEAHHECNHQDCMICEIIRASEEIQKQEIVTDPPAIVFTETTSFELSDDIIISNVFIETNTPITLKNKISF